MAPALKLLALCLPVVAARAAAALTSRDKNIDPIDYVDQLIGSSNGGNVFPGATVPYGMAKAVADTTSGSNQGGFTLDGTPVTGFSVLHDSGTGGSPSLGNFPLFPYNACADNDVNRCDFPKKTRAQHGTFKNDSVVAKPGYFSITLADGPQVEMTATHHAALFKFTFTGKDGDKPLILQDLTDLSNSRQDNASVAVDTTSGRIKGNALFVSSFSQGTYRAYFCTDFKGPAIADAGIFVDSRASADVHDLKISRSINGYPLPGGAFVRFADGHSPVYARVGVSLISEDQACASAEQEVPDFDFDMHAQDARDAWKAKMSNIQVVTEGVDASLIKNFYSGIYRTMVNPQNYTGENPLWNDGEPYFDSFYCIWDLFRSQLPFLTILDPAAVSQMIRSLISTYEHDGWLPDCRMSLSRGYTQGGSNADNVLADAYLKGIKDGVDWDKGYAAVKKDAEVEPFDWCCHGRGGIDAWNSLGYIPVQDFDYKGFGTLTRSLSRTLEYAYNDFAISQMAGGMGNKDEQETYIKSSRHWENLYRADQKSAFANGTDTGYTGFFQPKYLNQTWGYQDPLKCSNLDDKSVCSLQNSGPETFESSIWEYGFFVPHDQARLITLYGGPEAFCRRLDYLHDKGITYIGNEPAFLTVFQYHYAGRPALSAKRSHFYIPRFFQPTPPGLPGNDDSGAMGSFVAFSMMGLFPNPGQDVYLITPPFFPSVSIKNPVTGKTATIRNVNFDAAYHDIYIQSATLDGKEYTKNWIDHSFFTEGKELVLTLGKNESSWGTAVADLPPSLGPYLSNNQTLSRRWSVPGSAQLYQPSM
ncbi:alpha-1,2-mannosidase family protein, putative [Cordyceps militaris CM01]|uniref:Alpha-1,2-mannosidase family protein, putative n=1 Tax=Cordyceps militaris (strain CM01) TaxID=983644 RepID=G3JCK5_CORMM|nr:alpha-1,2-mannosidase family protein, putative [Cordyceps militaris CM01]EGX93817.1 alpha-1,2-mannosidase family protein, putative [Cordyceps militaris CM01]